MIATQKGGPEKRCQRRNAREEMTKAFQDLIPNNRCWGCGNLNAGGLQLKSYWSTPGETSSAIWTPQDVHSAGPKDVLNGGVISTLLDCQAVCTAIAHGYYKEGREIGEGEQIWYATGTLDVRFQAPTPIGGPVTLKAEVTESTEKRTNLRCTIEADGVETATAEVVAIRVPANWVTD